MTAKEVWSDLDDATRQIAQTPRAHDRRHLYYPHLGDGNSECESAR